MPGPPYPYLEAGGKQEIYDRLRLLRWDVWAVDRWVLLEEAWIINWQEWIEAGHLAKAVAHSDAARLCRDDDGPPSRLRANDQSLREVIPKFRDAMRKYSIMRESRIKRGKGWHPEELKKMVSMVSVYDSGAESDYLSKLTELWHSIGERQANVRDNASDIRKKIRKAHGCPSYPPHFNVCWSPSLQGTHPRLTEPRCADQR